MHPDSEDGDEQSCSQHWKQSWNPPALTPPWAAASPCCSSWQGLACCCSPHWWWQGWTLSHCWLSPCSCSTTPTSWRWCWPLLTWSGTRHSETFMDAKIQTVLIYVGFLESVLGNLTGIHRNIIRPLLCRAGNGLSGSAGLSRWS